MNITLYESVGELQTLLDEIDPDTGELPEGFGDARNVVVTKASAVGAYILQSEALSAMVEAKAKELLDRVAKQKRRNEWLRSYLTDNMLAAGITEIAVEHGSKIKLYPFRDASVEVFDERQVPAEYLGDPKPPPISKTKIRAAIDAGTEVPGAALVKKHRLTIK